MAHKALIIIPEGDIAAMDGICQAWDGTTGWGIAPRLCAKGDPTHTTTHRVTNADSIPLEVKNIWEAMGSAQDMPPTINGAVWGVDGVISAADAQDAMTRIMVRTATGPCQPSWADDQISNEGLEKVPFVSLD